MTAEYVMILYELCVPRMLRWRSRFTVTAVVADSEETHSTEIMRFQCRVFRTEIDFHRCTTARRCLIARNGENPSRSFGMRTVCQKTTCVSQTLRIHAKLFRQNIKMCNATRVVRSVMEPTTVWPPERFRFRFSMKTVMPNRSNSQSFFKICFDFIA